MYNKLDDITLYYYPEGEEAKIFTLKHNVISDLYVQYLNRYKPPKTTRISVQLSDNDYIHGYFGSILNVNDEFDKETYWQLDNDEKNKTILETLHRIALLCAEKYSWDKGIFIQAYNKVIESNYIYKIESRRKLSRDKKNQASILVEKNEKDAPISVLFYDMNENLIKKVEIIRTFNWQCFPIPIIKNYKWFKDNSFGLSIENEQLIIKTFLDNDKVVIHINPKERTKEELEGKLRYITYKEFDSEKDIIEWMNK